MTLIDHIRGKDRRAKSRPGPRATRRRPTLVEGLEDRGLLTILFTPQQGSPTIQDGHGDKLGQVAPEMPLYTIFWGAYWGTPGGRVQQAALENSLNTMFYSHPTLSGLRQYGVPYPAGVPGSGTVEVNDYSNPPNGFTKGNLDDVVSNAIDNLGLPEEDDSSQGGLYLVFTPPNVQSDQVAAGYHNFTTDYDFPFDFDTWHYAWIGNSNGQDYITNTISHEVMEAMTDPDIEHGIHLTDGDEICDGEAQSYAALIGGYEFASFWSAADNAYAVYDGNSQVVTFNNGNLIVNGDQFGSGTGDTITVDLNGEGQPLITLNGQTFSFTSDPVISHVTSITIDPGGGNNTIRVERTMSGAPVTINESWGNDAVYVGNGNLDNLRGAVTVHGGGSDRVNVNDQAAAFSDQYDVTGATVGRKGFGGLTYSGLAGLTLNAETGSNTINIHSTASGTPVTVNGEGGNDTLVGPNAASIWTITGANAGTVGSVTFTAIANLTGGTEGDAFRFAAAGSISGLVDGGAGPDRLDYSGDGGAAATVNLATAAATKTGGFASIDGLVGSSAQDTLIGPNAASTWTINVANGGTVGSFVFSAIETIIGGTGNDAFRFFPVGSISGLVAGGAGADTLDYSGDGGAAATVNLATGNATRTGFFASIEALVGSSAADTLIGPNAPASTIWNITANNAGTVGGLSFSAVENLTGGTGVDEFVFGAGKSVSGKVDGGGGENWLDYAAYTTPVAVDLTANTATGVAGGIAHIRDVRGGAGNDALTGNALGNILVGGGGADTITGGGGRSILVGGRGNDTVKGGSADDIVIAGITGYDGSGDANDLALEAILAEWQSGDSYATRITRIKAGVGAMLAKFVWGTTVTDDGNAGALTGGAGTDWFFKGVGDTIADRVTGEQVD